MQSVYYFIQTLAFFALFALVSGMIRPVMVLWFCAVVNRLGVLRYYGTAFAVLLSLAVLIKTAFLDS